MKAKSWFAEEKKTVLSLYPRQSILFTKGKGVYLYDAGGKRYLDFLSGIAVLPLGHCHPKITSAIKDQAAKLTHTSNLFYTLPYLKAARLLYKISHRKAFFCNSGAEANEALLKFARKWGSDKGKEVVLAEEGSFHGRTLGALSLTGQEKFKKGFGPLLPGIEHFPFGNISALKKKLSKRVVAIYLEPIQGEKGVFLHANSFLQEIAKLCQEKGLLFLLDEVQTGIGRTGKWFAYQHYGIQPDGIALAKGLGGGLPFGCALVNDRIAGVLSVGDHASTFGGNPVAARACVALLDTMMRKKTLRHVTEISAFFHEELEKLSEETNRIAELRQCGLMIGIRLRGLSAKRVVEQCLQQGLILYYTSDQDIRMLPPLIIKRHHVRKACVILRKILLEVQS